MNRSDTLWVATLLVLGAAGLLTFLHWQDRATPIASIDFKVSRDEAFNVARDYAEGHGHDLTGFEHAQTFGYDQAVQIFLQKTLGLEMSNALARDWVSVWTWRVRWFKPLDKEEIYIEVDPGGRIVAYKHAILDSEEGANLSIEEARAIASEDLTDRAGLDPADWMPIESSSEVRQARTDHTFTFRKRGWSAGDNGHYRLQVVVQGDAVGRYEEYVHVPETFLRAYRETRSRANLLFQVFSVLWIGLAIAVLVIVARRYRADTLPWRTGGIVGIAVTAAMIVVAINSWPTIRFQYETTQAYGTFVGMAVLQAIVGAIVFGGAVGLAGSAGQAVGWETFGQRVMPSLSIRGFVAGRFATSTLIGYGLAGVHLGYVVLFYLVGNRFGVWTPAELQDYSETFSTMFPWIYPLFVGLVASTSEEFLFRLVAISLMFRWTGIRWLSVLIPAIVWAFLHAHYPQEPIYIRGIELTVVGCIFGVAFLRWGIWSVVTSHYAFNAFVGAYPMINSSSIYFQVSGVAVVGLLALPLLAAIYGWATGRSDVTEPEEIAPAPVPESRVSDAQEVALDDGPSPSGWSLTREHRNLAAGVAVVGLAMTLGLPRTEFGEETLRLTADRVRAFAVADSVRTALGWDSSGSRTVTWYDDLLGRDDHTFLVRKLGPEAADSVIHVIAHPRRWTTRWFIPLEKTEWNVGVSPDGRVAYAERLLPDNTAGASMSKTEAQSLAGDFLRRHFDVDVSDNSQYKLLESIEEKHERRLDHTIVWERTDLKVEEGEFWVRVGVQGDEVGSFDFGFTAPESFVRALNERSLLDGVSRAVSTVCILVTVVLAGVLFLQLYRARTLDWRAGYAFGVLMGVSALMARLNDLPTIYAHYDTEQGLMTFLTSQSIGLMVLIAVLSLIAILAMGLANALSREELPGEVLPGRWVGGLFTGEIRGRLLLDCLLIAVALRLLWSGFGALRGYIDQTWFPELLNAEPHSPVAIESFLPILDQVANLSYLVLVLLGIYVAILVLKRTLKVWTRVCVAVVLYLLVVSLGEAETFWHGTVRMTLGALQALAMIAAARVLAGANVLAYFFAMVLGTLVLSGSRLMDTDVSTYQVSGGILLLLAICPFVYGLYTLNRPHES